MSLFAIADTHLSFASNKPMDDFEGWLNYTDRLKENWNKIIDDKDYVVIAGDISWAMNFDELKADFDYINQLNGKKIILKGNHDYWWNTMSKMNKFIEENNFNTISILHNNAFDFDDFSICGSRGWFFDSDEEQNEKVLNREVMRIKASIESALNCEKIVTKQRDSTIKFFVLFIFITISLSCLFDMHILNTIYQFILNLSLIFAPNRLFYTSN